MTTPPTPKGIDLTGSAYTVAQQIDLVFSIHQQGVSQPFLARRLPIPLTTKDWVAIIKTGMEVACAVQRSHNTRKESK